MPEIIPETRGRTPLPEEQRKKMISFRISPQSLEKLNLYVATKRIEGDKITKAQALENAIALLDR